MPINTNSVVTFHYRLMDAQSEQLLEDSANADPVLYLHGHNGLLPALEEALVDKQEGDNISATLPPEQAYGEPQANATGRVPLKQLRLSGGKPVRGKLAPGTIVEVHTTEGAREARVIKAGLKHVDIDTNHPYAGLTLQFDIRVISVRAATADELAHGHAHADGGCGH